MLKNHITVRSVITYLIDASFSSSVAALAVLLVLEGASYPVAETRIHIHNPQHQQTPPVRHS